MEIDKIILREEEEMTRRKMRKAVFGVLLAGMMAACLLLTVSTGIDFAKAEEVYRGVFQGYSAD